MFANITLSFYGAWNACLSLLALNPCSLGVSYQTTEDVS